MPESVTGNAERRMEASNPLGVWDDAEQDQVEGLTPRIVRETHVTLLAVGTPISF